jgi:hypothetical protein
LESLPVLAKFLEVDDHFLSAKNTLATADQRDVERRALALTDAPAYRQARAVTERRWRELVGSSPSKEAWSRFQTLIDECAFASLLKAVNGDPNYPRVVRIVMPPHDWFGMSVPGSRFAGGPGADQSYAIIPVDYGGRYLIHGRWIDMPPVDHNYTLSPNAYFMNSIGTLHHDNLVVGDDGRFTLTVGPEPGERNHIQTKPGAQYLFIRCCRSDWRQTATALRVEALNEPRTAPWTDEQVLARAAQIALDDASGMHYWIRFYANMPPNVVTKPNLTDAVGGLVSQTTSFGRIVLAADEALLISINPAGAVFHDVQLNDWWFNSIGDYYGRNGTLNNAQTKLGADGIATYIVSREDPGVHNWLDPNGLSETLFVARWQRLPREGGAGAPSIAAKLVKRQELETVLPADVARVSPQQRRAQLAERLAQYQLRLEI